MLKQPDCCWYIYYSMVLEQKRGLISHLQFTLCAQLSRNRCKREFLSSLYPLHHFSSAQSSTNYSYGKEKGFYFKRLEKETGCCRQKNRYGRKTPLYWFSFFQLGTTGRQHLEELVAIPQSNGFDSFFQSVADSCNRI